MPTQISTFEKCGLSECAQPHRHRQRRLPRETCMELSDYQRDAQATDQLPTGDENDLIVPLLGMAGEVGSLLVEFKKHLRDGQAHTLFPEQMAEELGDVLWYLANTATKFNLDLG